MAKQRNALRAGIFIVVSIALTIFVILAIAGTGRFTRKYAIYEVIFRAERRHRRFAPGDDVASGA